MTLPIGVRRAAMALLVVTAGLSPVLRARAADPLGGNSLLADAGAYAALASEHLTGTGSEAKTQAWVRDQLSAAGVQTGEDAYSFLGFNPRTVALSVSGTPFGNLAAYFYSGTTGPQGVTAPLADAGHGTQPEITAAKVPGKIAVVDVPFVDGAVGPTMARAYQAVASAGAAGMVAVTEGPQDYAVNQDVDSRAGVGSLPTILIGKRSGAQVVAAAKQSEVATLTLDAATGDACDTNVWGVLPGADPDRYVVVGTPTSGFVPAASERGAGVAIMLGLARHYAAIPLAGRPVGIVFVALSGHEAGYLGLPTFMQMHQDWFAMADAYVHLGASIAAVAQVEDPNGEVHRLPAGDPTRALYASENPLLQAIVAKAFAPAQPLGALPPAGYDPGEQGFAYHAGIPIVAISGASYYFHTAGDQPDGVSADLLASAATSFRDAVDGIAGLPRGALRNANLAAAQAGKAQSPNATPGGGGGGTHLPQPVASCADPQPVQPPASADYAIDPAHASLALGLAPGYEDSEPGFAWEGRWQSRDVQFASSRTGARLFGVIDAPNPLPSGPVPAVVIVPGSGPGVQSFYQWAARELAGHGYVALAVDPQGVGRSETFGTPQCTAAMPDPSTPYPCTGVPFQQAGNYVDAAESGIDFLLSSANPYRTVTDAGRIGAAGHSLGARGVSYAQGIDPRIKAIVAWDNLASALEGDAGSPSGGPPAGTLIGGTLPGPPQPVTVRVPALGEASDNTGTSAPQNKDPEQKKTAYDVWRAQGVASMEVVFRGSGHLDWAQAPSNQYSVEADLQNFEYYTRAWFDLFLLGDATAASRLLATTVNGSARNDLLSTKFTSAAFLPAEGIDCPNLTACPG